MMKTMKKIAIIFLLTIKHLFVMTITVIVSAFAAMGVFQLIELLFTIPPGIMLILAIIFGYFGVALWGAIDEYKEKEYEHKLEHDLEDERRNRFFMEN